MAVEVTLLLRTSVAIQTASQVVRHPDWVEPESLIHYRVDVE